MQAAAERTGAKCQQLTFTLADISVADAAALIRPVAVCAGHARAAGVAVRSHAAPTVVHQTAISVSHWIAVVPGPRRLAHVLVQGSTAGTEVDRTDKTEPVIVVSNTMI